MKANIKQQLLLAFIIILLISACKPKDESPIETSNETLPSITKVKLATPQNNPKPTALCSSDLLQTIRQSAQKHEGTPYSVANKTDCSGMFHKVLGDVQKACPQAKLPLLNDARSSRDLARWYHDNGEFQIIRDSEKSGHLIHPGAVMFYGQSGKIYNQKTLTIEEMTTAGEGVNHIGVVTEVEVKDGKIVSYQLFHGRRPGKPAITSTLYLATPHNPDVPPYGNWKEPWLGIAELLP